MSLRPKFQTFAPTSPQAVLPLRHSFPRIFSSPKFESLFSSSCRFPFSKYLTILLPYPRIFTSPDIMYLSIYLPLSPFCTLPLPLPWIVSSERVCIFSFSPSLFLSSFSRIFPGPKVGSLSFSPLLPVFHECFRDPMLGPSICVDNPILMGTSHLKSYIQAEGTGT